MPVCRIDRAGKRPPQPHTFSTDLRPYTSQELRPHCRTTDIEHSLETAEQRLTIYNISRPLLKNEHQKCRPPHGVASCVTSR